MTEGATHQARPPIARAILLGLTIALVAGCAADSSNPPSQSGDNFEIRAMIASDREAMHAMDQRMRRIEDQLQELTHGGGGSQPGSAEAAGVPAAPEAPPPPAPASPPAAVAPPPGASLPLGAPPAPEASAGGDSGPAAAPGAPPGGDSGLAAASGTPSGGDSGPAAANGPPADAPVAAAPPASPAAGAPDESDTTTIASAPGRPPGAASPPPAGDDNGGDSGNAENGATEGNSAAEAAPAPEANAAENGNPEARPPENAATPADNGEEGGAPAAQPAPHAGEEVASAPPAAVPENAPATAPPRWPQDLDQELQSPANGKGGAGKLYRSGLDAMKSRDYSAAVVRFDMIQKKYPHSDLTEPAAYFSATALNEMGKYDQAILQYNDLVMRYPKGKYSSEALLREGQAFLQINDKIDARLTLQKLVNEQAGTPQAAEASAMLKNLESN